MDIDKEIGKIKYHEDLELGSCKILKNISGEFKSMLDRIAFLKAVIDEANAQEPVAVQSNNGSVMASRDFCNIDDFVMACRNNTPLYAHPIPAQQSLISLHGKWDYGEDNDGWYVERNEEQICYCATEENARYIAERMNAAVGTSQQAPAVAVPVSRDVIREVFMRNGFTVKEGQSDLKDYVFNAAYDLLSLSPRITEQDLETICLAFMSRKSFSNYTNEAVALRQWSKHEEGQVLLNKLNNNPTTQEVTHHPV